MGMDGELEKRAQRAARFQAPPRQGPASRFAAEPPFPPAVADGGPLVGELEAMCSPAEAKDRQEAHQLSPFEWRAGADPRHPEANLAIATKKYQRSAAGRTYLRSEVRTLAACWRTLKFLLTEVLDLDLRPKPPFAVQKASYAEVYAYLRDRTRAVRVDLLLQQPRSTATRCFVEVHECCLRFEMLSLFLLGGSSVEGYDANLGKRAVLQTIEPLTQAYQALRTERKARSLRGGEEEAEDKLQEEEEAGDERGREDLFAARREMAVQRYIILLLTSFSPSSESLLAHLAKLPREVLLHPLVKFATQAATAFCTEDYGGFLRLYRVADFLTALAMSGVADLARLRALSLLARSYPSAVGDRVPMARIKHSLAFASDAHAQGFLAFHGVQVLQGSTGTERGDFAVLPKKGSPEFENLAGLTRAGSLPETCGFPAGTDSMLISKREALGLDGCSRADIVFGCADPKPKAAAAATAAAAEAPLHEVFLNHVFAMPHHAAVGEQSVGCAGHDWKEP